MPGTPKYRLRLGKLDFISAVDRPAQETATVALIKRKGELVPEKRLVVRAHKVADEIGLVFGWAFTSKIDGADYYDLQGDAISEDEIIKVAAEFMERSAAMDEMHDGVAKGTTVFAMPWTAEIAKAFLGIDTDTSGLMVAIKPPPDVLEKFKTGEYTGWSIGGSGVREPVEAKRAPDRNISKRGHLTSATNGHAHLVDDEMTSGHTSWEGEPDGHSHPFVIDDEGAITIGEAHGHTHTAMTKRAPYTGELSAATSSYRVGAGEFYAGSVTVGITSSGTSSATEVTTAKTAEENDMKDIEKLQQENDRLRKIAELNDAEKAHLKTLDASGQGEFLAKSATERAEIVTKATEVVYESPITGTKFTKSDDPRMIEAVKAADRATADARTREMIAKRAALAKRADDELGNLPGDPVVKVAFLEALESVPEEQRAGVTAMLKAANDIAAKGFETVGRTKGGEIEDGSALAQLNALTQKRMSDHGELEGVAFNKVLETAEGQRLFAEYRAASN